MEISLHFSPKHALAILLFASLSAHAQQPTPPAPQPAPAQQQTTQPQTAPATTPHGEVLFQSHGEPPTSPQDAAPAQTSSAAAPKETEPPTGPPLTDKERSALLFTAYDLDARITPALSHLSMRARLTLRNTSDEPLSRIALQISSTLHWESASLIPSAHAAPAKLPLAQHLIDTDADHTGQANEAIVTLPLPLAPGGSITLDTFYAGTIKPSAGRLDRIGANPEQALAADWDAIASSNASSNASTTSSNSSPTGSIASTGDGDLDTALRGFGDVLWYPVAEPQLFLGDGAALFHAIDRTRLREQNASIHLRLAVEYQGDPPVAVYFCGRRQPMVALPDDPDAPVATGRGIASADFSAEPIGFRLPSLFVVDNPESLIAPLPGSSGAVGAVGSSGAATASATPMLAVETTDDGVLPRLADSAQSVAPLLQQWFGARPLTALTILDHSGQPFEDGPLLVAPIASLAASDAAGALAHSLTHAWVQTGQPWMDEGLAEFVSLLWTEQQKGREAANAQLDELIQPLNLAEPDFAAPPSPAPPSPASPLPPPTEPSTSSSSSATAQPAAEPLGQPLGQPLITASSELYYRRKAAAVWWMLRDIAGDDPLREALSAWRTQPISHDTPQAQAEAFEKLLEKTSGKDLGWFFDDWVLHDRGLPDLSIVDVTPRLLPAGQGHDTGWLVAVTVHNAGAAAAEVPLVIRSGELSIARRLRIPGLSDATDRVVIEAPPTEVIVNDGSVPEIRTSTHTLTIVPKSQQ
jgi:hypothetical protein